MKQRGLDVSPKDAGAAPQQWEQSEARFRAFVTASNDVVYSMNPDWSEMRRLSGRGFVADTDQPRRDWISEYIHPDDQPKLRSAIREALQHNGVFELEHRIKRVDGSYGWTLSRAVPILDTTGNIVEWFGAASDITQRREAVEALAYVTAEGERQKQFYESLISSTPDLVYAFDREYHFIFANRALLEMWGRTMEESAGKRLIEVGYEPWHAEMHEREIDKVIATGHPIRGEVGFRHATLGPRVYDYIFTPVFNAAGEVETIAGTTRDITDIKRTEEHLQLLINELNHRVKNTLATIQSLATQTFRGGLADPGARKQFEARLMALSQAHTVLTRKNWESASMAAIVATALAPFNGPSESSDRISVAGPDLDLRPQVALALAMALHELASNAVKYGALSNDSGKVTIAWENRDGRLSVAWKESGGPPVAPPQRTGFGSRLVDGLARELDGSAGLNYLPGGVECQISFPVADKVQKHAQ